MLTPVLIYGPDGARRAGDVRAGDRVYAAVDERLQVHTVTGTTCGREPAVRVRTRNRTVTAAGHRVLLILRPSAGQVVHRDAADWPGVPQGSRRGARCSVSTCQAAVLAVGMCSKHYQRWQAHGDPRLWATTARRYETAWMRLDQLQRGDLLVQVGAMPTHDQPGAALADHTLVDAEVAWLVGAIVGDGSVTTKGLRLALYGARRDRAAGIIESCWGGRCHYRDDSGLVISNVRLRDVLTALGMRRLGPDKRVPTAVWTWPGSARRAFLDGYCDADGHRPADPVKHGERTYHSASRELIEDVRAMHLMLGDAVSNVTTTRRPDRIVIKGQTVQHALDLHAFTVWRKGARGEALLRRTPELAQWLDRSDFTAAQVLGVEEMEAQQLCSVDVSASGNCVADGVVLGG
jgi:hypothetical protein